MLAPVIPGLNDSEIPALLAAARDAGATGAGYVLLKLSTTVKDVFLDWLKRSYPDRYSKVEAMIRSMREGKLNDTKFGRRQRGTGHVADLIADTFHLWNRKLGYPTESLPLNTAAFRPPQPTTGQSRLF